MTEKQVDETFDDSELFIYSGGLTPTPQVKRTISQLTSAWESMGKNRYHRDWRREFLKSRISHVLSYRTGDTTAKADRVCRDVDYWRSILLVLFEKGEDRFKPDFEKINAQYQVLGAHGGVPPISERISVAVSMGQGAAGDLKKFILHSSKFHSCSAIALYNNQDDMGGLFHYAARNSSQHNKLLEMSGKINPTLVGMYVHTQEDLAPVEALFPTLTVNAFDAYSSSYALYLTDQGEVAFESTYPGSAAAALNLTGLTNIPDEISQDVALSMYHEPDAYGEIFEAFPYHG